MLIGGCPICGNIGCTECGVPAIVNEDEIKRTSDRMAAMRARFDAGTIKTEVTGVDWSGGTEPFLPRIVTSTTSKYAPPEMPIDG